MASLMTEIYMSDPGGFVKGATIEYGSMQLGGGHRHLFGLNTSSASYWFEAELEFDKSGNEFAMLIMLFGKLERNSTIYKSFNSDEIIAIKKVLEEYFTLNDVEYFCVMVQNHRPFAFRYQDDWILEGNGELYRRTGPGTRSLVRRMS
jgi:hypothetical protein